MMVPDPLDVLRADPHATAATLHAIMAARCADDDADRDHWQSVAAATVGRLF